MAVITDEIRAQLVQKAIAARQKAYAPYSKFSVGAAVLVFFSDLPSVGAAVPVFFRICFPPERQCFSSLSKKMCLCTTLFPLSPLFLTI